MLYAIMTKPGDIEFREAEKPVPGDNDVLIKMIRIGVCGSDIHVYHGKHPYTSYPVIQGHEVSGEVIEIGKNVSRIKVGDKVVVQPQVVCGECYPCRTGDYNICDSLKVMGFQTEGLAKEYCSVDESKVLKVPDSMSFDQAAVVEPAAVACHALGRSKMDLSGKNILVLGAGTIGNLVAQAAKAKGAAKVIITDLSDFRLNIAKECGIDVTVNTSREKLSDVILREFGSDKADLILECVGVQPTITDAVANARKGSSIIIVGVYPDEVKVNMGLVQDREISLIGTLMYKEEDYKEAIKLISENKIKADKIITDYFSFKDYDAAYKHIQHQGDKVMKVMIKIAE